MAVLALMVIKVDVFSLLYLIFLLNYPLEIYDCTPWFYSLCVDASQDGFFDVVIADFTST
jgi:hypothetical protein